MSAIKTYVAGVGKITFGSGMNTSTETPFLSISDLEFDRYSIGTDLVNSGVPEVDRTLIYFKNLEGLGVLERMIKDIKQKLKNQEKAKQKIS